MNIDMHSHSCDRLLAAYLSEEFPVMLSHNELSDLRALTGRVHSQRVQGPRHLPAAALCDSSQARLATGLPVEAAGLSPAKANRGSEDEVSGQVC